VTPAVEEEEGETPLHSASEFSRTKVNFFAELERIKQVLVENEDIVPEDQREQFKQLLEDNLNEEVIEAGVMKRRKENAEYKKKTTIFKKKKHDEDEEPGVEGDE